MDSLKENLLQELLTNVDEDIKDEVSLHLEEDLNKTLIGHFDFCIICSERDLEEVAEFKFNFCEKYNLIGVFELDEVFNSVPETFRRTQEMVERSTKTFIYITENFNNDSLCIFQKDELLMTHIKDPANAKNIVPIYTKPFNKYIKKIPYGISIMTGFKLFAESRDDFRVKNTFDAQTRKLREIREKKELLSLKREYQYKLNELVCQIRSRNHNRTRGANVNRTDDDDDDDDGNDDDSEDSDSSGPVCNQNIQTHCSGTIETLHVGNRINIQSDNPDTILRVIEATTSLHQITLNGTVMTNKEGNK